MFKLNPPRPTFSQDMTATEREVMMSHVAYWSALAEKGTAVVFGPVADPAGGWGVGIIETDSLTTAQDLLAKDPASMSGIPFKYELFPMVRAVLRPNK